MLPLTLAWGFPSKSTGYVTDDAGVLDASTRARMEQLLGDLEQKTTNEVAVVTLKSLEGLPIEDVAVTLFKQWGIGKKDRNNGVLFLIAPNERRMRIEVGYGLEWVLPDARSGRILEDDVAPFFKQGRMAEGLWNGTSRIAEYLFQDAVPQKRHRGAHWLQILFILIVLLMFGRHPLFLWFLLSSHGGRGGSGRWSGGGFGGGGFGGFGGGMSGGGGSSRGW